MRAPALLLAGLAAVFAACAQDAPGSPWQWQAVLKTDTLHTDRPAQTSGVGLLDLLLDVDLERLLGWPGTTLRVEGLLTEGGKPNRRVGTLQGLSNLEVARNSGRLYGAVIEHAWREGASVLFGLYDVNSEFYSTESSALLIHPAFGVGTELAQTGANGPSIFPNLGLALRVRTGFGDGMYVQAAVADGVPGELQDAGRTWVHLSAREGALLLVETGRQRAAAGDARPMRWGAGLWNYTRAAPKLDASGSGRSAGAYVLAELPVRTAERARTTAFMRAGVANPELNVVGAALDAGVLVENPWGPDGPVALTAGLATASIGGAGRRAIGARGEAPARAETAFEAGVRFKPLATLVLQPLVQHVIAAGGRRGRDVSVIGLRLEWSPLR
jgi:porin